MGLEDRVVRDKELEQMLEEWEVAKEKKATSTAEFKEADKKCQDKIATITTPKPYRVNRFIIDDIQVSERVVDFTTPPTTRLSIKLVGE